MIKDKHRKSRSLSCTWVSDTDNVTNWAVLDSYKRKHILYYWCHLTSSHRELFQAGISLQVSSSWGASGGSWCWWCQRFDRRQTRRLLDQQPAWPSSAAKLVTRRDWGSHRWLWTLFSWLLSPALLPDRRAHRHRLWWQFWSRLQQLPWFLTCRQAILETQESVSRKRRRWKEEPQTRSWSESRK